MTYNKILKSTIRDLKQRFYHAEFAKYTGNMKMTWRTIGVVMSKKAKKDDLPPIFLAKRNEKSSGNGRQYKRNKCYKKDRFPQRDSKYL